MQKRLIDIDVQLSRKSAKSIQVLILIVMVVECANAHFVCVAVCRLAKNGPGSRREWRYANSESQDAPMRSAYTLILRKRSVLITKPI